MVAEQAYLRKVILSVSSAITLYLELDEEIHNLITV